jgi:undecaprenyl-diphosphatase
MNELHAALLGLIQGLTEFLPVSSSAHLALAHWLTGWTFGDRGNLVFDVALHAGTLVALLIYFGRDWIALLTKRGRLLWYVLAACVPGAIFGVLLEKKAETAFRAPLHIAILLGVMGVVLFAAEAVGKKKRELGAMTWRDAIWIGLSQALAIMPGVSRSGITMTTALFLDLDREAAARFSFLLATPITAGAVLWESRHLAHGGVAAIGAAPLLVGVVVAAVSGLACIHFLLRFLQRHTFYPFAIYRVLAAATVIGLIVSGLVKG